MPFPPITYDEIINAVARGLNKPVSPQFCASAIADEIWAIVGDESPHPDLAKKSLARLEALIDSTDETIALNAVKEANWLVMQANSKDD